MNILNTVYTLRFFSLQNAVCFIILTYLVSVLFTFYIQGVTNIKTNNSGAKKVKEMSRDWDLKTKHELQSTDNSLWKRRWTYRKTDYVMMMMIMMAIYLYTETWL